MNTFLSKCRVSISNKLDDISYTIYYKFSDIFSYFNYKFFVKSNVIKTGLEPKYQSHPDRILYGMFSVMTEFVEKDKSWMQFRSEKTDFIHTITNSNYLRRFFIKLRRLYFRYFNKHDVKFGLEHLKWEISLDSATASTHQRSERQAHIAREIWDLYHWWKYIRPMRLDPDEASGWSKWIDSRRKLIDGNYITSAMATTKDKELSMLSTDIEQQYEQEDNNQLIRLINIRGDLWI